MRPLTQVLLVTLQGHLYNAHLLLIVVVEWIPIHSTPYFTSYSFTESIVSIPSTVAIAEHCFYHSVCVVSLLIDIIQRQYQLWSGYQLTLKAVHTVVWLSWSLEPKAVIHCGPGIISHSVDTLDTCAGASTFTPDLGVVSKYLLGSNHAKLPLNGVPTVVSQFLQ